VGRSGRTVVYERLPKLVRDWRLDLVIANGENAAGGFGITETICRELIGFGLPAGNPGHPPLAPKKAPGFHSRARAPYPLATAPRRVSPPPAIPPARRDAARR